MGIKIGIIGAGSATFSLKLVRDLCLTPSLSESMIMLMDVDVQRLDDVYRLSLRYAEELGQSLRIEKTTERVECIAGADFVINTALGPGLDRLVEGWQIAFRHGYRFGGSLHVMHDEAFWINYHQLTLIEEIARDIETHAPDAWYVVVANPVLAAITYLARRFPGMKTVGLCHGYSGVFHLAKTIGLDPNRVQYDIPGVNHFVWLTRFEQNGVDVMPALERWVRDESSSYFERCGICDHAGPKAVDLYRRFGVFPIGDTGNPGGGSWGYWYHADVESEARWKEDPWTWYQKMIHDGNRRVAEIARVTRDRTVNVSDVFGTRKSTEVMVPLVECLSGLDERELIVNVVNSGSWVEGIPTDFEVEVPATVGSAGIRPRRTEPLPPAVQRFAQRDRVAPVELELEAYRRGSRELLTELLLMDPWTRSGGQARALVQEILELPYNRPMKEHYR